MARVVQQRELAKIVEGRVESLIAMVTGSGFVLAIVDLSGIYQAIVYGFVGGAAGYIARQTLVYIVKGIKSKIKNTNSSK